MRTTEQFFAILSAEILLIISDIRNMIETQQNKRIDLADIGRLAEAKSKMIEARAIVDQLGTE